MPDDRDPDLNRNADIEYDREQVGRNSEEDLVDSSVDSSDDEFEDVDELDDEQEEMEER